VSSFSIAIVSHESRDEVCQNLAAEVDADRVFIDDGTIGPGRNHRRAWEWLAEQEDTWGVVLEDDAVPVEGFRDQLWDALGVAPTPVVSLYLGRSRPAHRQHSINRALGMMSVDGIDPSWLVSQELLHHVGVAVHGTQLESLCEYLPWHLRSEMPIDEIVSRWAQRGPKCQVSYTWPSLVDHNDELPTTIIDRRSFLTDALYGEQEDRSKDDPRLKRVAWKTGTRADWNSLCFPF
jgi:hypothetical protein